MFAVNVHGDTLLCVTLGGGCKVQYSYRSETGKKVFYLCNVLRRWEKYSHLHREWKGVPDGLGVCRGGMADILDKGC